MSSLPDVSAERMQALIQKISSVRPPEILSLNDKEIECLIPHRLQAFMSLEHAIYDPLKPNDILVIKRLDKWDPEFRGHFVDNLVYPGHWMLEFCNLAAAILVKLKFPDFAGYPAIAGHDKIRYKGKTVSEDIIRAYVTLTKSKAQKFFFFNGRILNQKDVEIFSVENIIGTAI